MGATYVVGHGGHLDGDVQTGGVGAQDDDVHPGKSARVPVVVAVQAGAAVHVHVGHSGRVRHGVMAKV